MISSSGFSARQFAFQFFEVLALDFFNPLKTSVQMLLTHAIEAEIKFQILMNAQYRDAKKYISLSVMFNVLFDELSQFKLTID